MNYDNLAPLAGPATGTGLALTGTSTWVAVTAGAVILGAGLYTSAASNRRRRREARDLEEALRR